MKHLSVVTYKGEIVLSACTGASDDAVSCSIMLEVLRIMSRDPLPHLHCVMFIFNGAEENVLQVLKNLLFVRDGE